VQENAEAAFWENRLSITTEMEALISVYGAIFWKESTDSEVHETEVHKNQCDNRRLNFSVVPSVMPSQEDITPFFNWWFSHINSGCERPTLMTRIRTFYSYSQWDDIVYPGIVLERILYGLKYNAELTTVKSGKRIPWILSKCLFTFVSYLLFLIHVVVIVVVFIFGFFSLGHFWPRSMKKRLFHMHFSEHLSETEERNNKNDRLKDELRGDIERNHKNIRRIERTVESMRIKQQQGLDEQKEQAQLIRDILTQLERIAPAQRK